MRGRSALTLSTVYDVPACLHMTECGTTHPPETSQVFGASLDGLVCKAYSLRVKHALKPAAEGRVQQQYSSDTVHLQVIRWLEQYLTSRDVSVVVVTHDRTFMESICTSVLELEAGEVTLHNFGGPGSYDRFRQVRTQLTLRRECSQP